MNRAPFPICSSMVAASSCATAATEQQIKQNQHTHMHSNTRGSSGIIALVTLQASFTPGVCSQAKLAPPSMHPRCTPLVHQRAKHMRQDAAVNDCSPQQQDMRQSLHHHTTATDCANTHTTCMHVGIAIALLQAMRRLQSFPTCAACLRHAGIPAPPVHAPG
jgi:hypothetical protein